MPFLKQLKISLTVMDNFQDSFLEVSRELFLQKVIILLLRASGLLMGHVDVSSALTRPLGHSVVL